MRENKSKTRFAQPALRGAFLIFFIRKNQKMCIEWSRMIPGTKKKIKKKNHFFDKNSYKTCILVLNTYFEGTLTFKTYKN